MFTQCFEILTIGLPFCAFKFVTGALTGQSWLIALSVIDLFINVVNLVLLLIHLEPVFDTCLLSFIVRKIKKPDSEIKPYWQDLGNALDVVLSFSLVAYMIGGSHLKEVSTTHLQLWNTSVILNVLGAGFSRLTTSIAKLNQNR